MKYISTFFLLLFSNLLISQDCTVCIDQQTVDITTNEVCPNPVCTIITVCDDGTTYNGANPTFVPSILGDVICETIITDALGCADTSSITIEVIELNISCLMRTNEGAGYGAFSAVCDTTICEADGLNDIILYATPFTAQAVYTWTDPAGNVIGNGFFELLSNLEASDSGIYSVTVELGPCVESLDFDINIIESLPLSCRWSDRVNKESGPFNPFTNNCTVEICSDGLNDILFSPLPVSNATNCTVEKPDGTIVTAGATGIVIISDVGATDSGDYIYRCTDGNGCPTELVYSVDITEPCPVCEIVVDGGEEINLCDGDPFPDLSPTVTGGQGNITYLWSTGATTSTISTSSVGVYIVTVTDDIVPDCTEETSWEIIVNPLPNCEAINDTPVCSFGTFVQFDEIGGDAVAWEWTDPNGNVVSTIQNPSIGVPLANVGIYTVEVTDANGCTNTCETEVIFLEFPECDLEAVQLVPCTGEFQLTSLPNDAVSWLWSDGQTGQSITVNANNNPSQYAVTITNADGCVTASCVIDVAWNEQFVSCSLSSDGPNCEGDITTLTETGGDAVSWDWGPGVTDLGGGQGTVTAQGLYGVTVTDADGCTNECELQVNYNPVTPIYCGMRIIGQNNGMIFYGTCDTTICVGSTPAVFIRASGDILAVCDLTLPNGTVINNVLQHDLVDPQVSDSGTYIFSCTDQWGCPWEVVFNLEFIECCELEVEPGETIDLCDGDPYPTLTPVYSGDNGTISFSWSSGQNTASINPTASGTYTVTVTDDIEPGCTGTATWIINDPLVTPLCVWLSENNPTGGVQSCMVEVCNDEDYFILQPAPVSQVTGCTVTTPSGVTTSFTSQVYQVNNADFEDGTWTLNCEDANGCPLVWEYEVSIENCCDCEVTVTKLDDCTLQACWSGDCSTVNRWVWSADSDCQNGNSSFGSSQSGPCTTLDLNNLPGGIPATGYFSFFVQGSNGCPTEFGDCIEMECEDDCDCAACSNIQQNGNWFNCSNGNYIVDLSNCSNGALSSCEYNTFQILVNGVPVVTDNSPSCLQFGNTGATSGVITFQYISDCGCPTITESINCGGGGCPTVCSPSTSVSGCNIFWTQCPQGWNCSINGDFTSPYVAPSNGTYQLICTNNTTGCTTVTQNVTVSTCNVTSCGCSGSSNITIQGCTINDIGSGCGNGYAPTIVNANTNQFVGNSLPFTGQDGETYFVVWTKSGCPNIISNQVTASCQINTCFCNSVTATISGCTINMSTSGSCGSYSVSVINAATNQIVSNSVPYTGLDGVSYFIVLSKPGCTNVISNTVTGSCPTVICNTCNVTSSFNPNTCQLSYSVSGQCANYDLAIIECGGGNPTCSGNACAGGGSIVQSQSQGWTGSNIFNVPSNGSYSVVLFGNNGCTNINEDCYNVTTCQACNCFVGITGSSAPICSGDCVQITAQSTSGCASPVSWDWGHTNSTASTVTVCPTSTTTYEVEGTDDNGCSDDATFTVVVGGNCCDCSQTPVLITNISASPSTICPGESSTLSVSVTGGCDSNYSYQWSNGAGNGASVTVSPSSSTTYSVVITDSNGCSITGFVQVTVVDPCSANGSICPQPCATMSSFLNSTGSVRFNCPSDFCCSSVNANMFIDINVNGVWQNAISPFQINNPCGADYLNYDCNDFNCTDYSGHPGFNPNGTNTIFFRIRFTPRADCTICNNYTFIAPSCTITCP